MRNQLVIRRSIAPADYLRTHGDSTARLAAGLEAAYGQAKACHDVAGKPVCRNIDELGDIIAKSRDYNALTTAWTDWHDTAKPTRADYTRFVELANEGAREMGYADLGAMWRSGYDMPPDDFANEVNQIGRAHV